MVLFAAQKLYLGARRGGTRNGHAASVRLLRRQRLRSYQPPANNCAASKRAADSRPYGESVFAVVGHAGPACPTERFAALGLQKKSYQPFLVFMIWRIRAL